jgi:hypothetical protein
MVCNICVLKLIFSPLAEFLEGSWKHWGIIPIWEEALLWPGINCALDNKTQIFWPKNK